MPRYVVLESDIETKGQKIRVMRDGFAVLAIGFPLPWLIFHRLWFEAIMLLPFLLAISMFSNHSDTMGIVLIGNLALGLVIALEGDGRIIARMKRSGFREVATVAEAENLNEAEFHVAFMIDGNALRGAKKAKKSDQDAELERSDMILGLT
ncbi:MAG: DUF2628 domain-containing protein [Pseudomonadota bacterium]